MNGLIIVPNCITHFFGIGFFFFFKKVLEIIIKKTELKETINKTPITRNHKLVSSLGIFVSYMDHVAAVIRLTDLIN